jgi:branched-chain amino acid transport system substrate-binding protein
VIQLVRSRKVLAASLVAIVVLTPLTTAAALPGNAQASHARAYSRVTIGVSVPLLNVPDLAYGMAHAVQVAVSRANASGVVPGVTFAVRILDDTVNHAVSPQKDGANAHVFIEDASVIGEVGPLNSAAAKVSEAVYNAAGMAQVSVNSNPDLTNPALRATYQPRAMSGKGPITYYRTVTTDAFQGPVDAFYAANVLHAKRIFVTDNTDAYGVGLANAFRAECAKLRVQVVGSGQLDLTQAKLGATQLANKIAKAGGGTVDLVYFGGEYDATSGGGTLLADALKAAGVKARFMAGDAVFSPSFISDSANGGVLGAYVSNLGPDKDSFPSAAPFRAAEQKLFPKTAIAAYDMEAYDAANIIIAAYTKAVRLHLVTVGSPMSVQTRSAIAKLVGQTNNFRGASGVISFDANGDILSHAFSFYQVLGQGKTAAWKYVGLSSM